MPKAPPFPEEGRGFFVAGVLPCTCRQLYRSDVEWSTDGAGGAPEMTTYTEDQMTAIDGRPWQGANGTRRVYLNDWPTYIGLDLEHYKSGNISHAELDGTKLSNSSAHKLAAAKVYWQDGTIYTNLNNVADGI